MLLAIVSVSGILKALREILIHGDSTVIHIDIFSPLATGQVELLMLLYKTFFSFSLFLRAERKQWWSQQWIICKNLGYPAAIKGKKVQKIYYQCIFVGFFFRQNPLCNECIYIYVFTLWGFCSVLEVWWLF